jgi:hypothetical protein
VDIYIILGDFMADLEGLGEHRMAGKFPCRLPVWWARHGDVGKQPQTRGVSGKRITLRIEKKFNKFERVLARIFRAPRELKRPLDTMNSLVWELCDGHRTFDDICQTMNDTFHDEITPVIHRTELAIVQFMRLNLMLVLDTPLDGKWQVGPGITPQGQTLQTLDGDFFETQSLEGEIS